jgi:hypothetical protein
MSEYVITDDMLGRPVLTGGDLKLLPKDMWAENGGGYDEFDSVKPKFDSVGALIAWVWSDGSGAESETCGNSEFGNGWNARFDSERLLLHTDSQGFVTARRLADDEDMDTTWEEIEKGAVDSEGVPWGHDEDDPESCGCGCQDEES